MRYFLFIVFAVSLVAPAPAQGQGGNVSVSVPSYVRAGSPYKLTNIRLHSGDDVERKAKGKVFYRQVGQKDFLALALATYAQEAGLFGCEIPGEVTQKPFEFYLEITTDGKKSVCFPAQGADAPMSVKPDATPPGKVGELNATTVKSSIVVLEWRPATDDTGVAEYRVYRGEDERFELNDQSLLTKLTADQLSYSDIHPRMGKAAWYVIQAVDRVGQAGDALRLKVDVPDLKAPDNKLELKVQPASLALKLSWTGNVDPDIAGFVILRAEGVDGEFKELKKLTGMNHREYTDAEVSPGKFYRYAVKMHSTTFLISAPTATVSARPLRFAKRINCGGPEIPMPDGFPWEADQGSRSDSSASSVTDDIANTEGWQQIYQYERWSNKEMQYKFDVPPGTYRVTLHFAETNWSFKGFGKRTFDVVINGEKVAEKLDIFSKAGAFNAWRLVRKVTVGKEKPEMKIQLIANPIGPAIKGIEIFAED